jgi:UDP-glucose 4-epimerase
MPVLITGGMGALGSAVARKFVQEGETPILYDLAEDYTLISDIIDKVTYVSANILDFERLSATIKHYEIDTIIHTVAVLSKADPKISIELNTRSTENVLWAAKECTVRKVVYTSSKAVFSEITGPHLAPTYKPINEDYPKERPMGVYGVTKFYGELLGYQFKKLYDIDFVSLRYSTVYGPGRLLKNPNSPMVLPCRIIENAMLGKPFSWPRGGEQKDDYIYYDDVARGTFLAATVNNPPSGVYLIGTQLGATLWDFAASAKKHYPEFEADIGPGLDHVGSGFIFYSIYDISRAKEELGFAPECDFETGVERYIEAMKKLNIPPTYVK